MTVSGTAADDRFEFSAAASRRLTVKGVEYNFTDAEVTAVTFDGLGGNDSITVDGGPGVSLRADGFRSVTATATAGGQKVARLYDSDGNETFTAYPTYAVLANGTTYSNRANDFRFVMAYANQGGNDSAALLDCEGNDTLTTTPTYGTMTGKWRPEGASVDRSFYNRANYFDQVVAASSGGTDLARFFDSAFKDVFTLRADSKDAVMTGSGYVNQALKFRYVYATATTGGDEASLYDSPGDDKSYTSGNVARL